MPVSSLFIPELMVGAIENALLNANQPWLPLTAKTFLIFASSGGVLLGTDAVGIKYL